MNCVIGRTDVELWEWSGELDSYTEYEFTIDTAIERPCAGLSRDTRAQLDSQHGLTSLLAASEHHLGYTRCSPHDVALGFRTGGKVARWMARAIITRPLTVEEEQAYAAKFRALTPGELDTDYERWLATAWSLRPELTVHSPRGLFTRVLGLGCWSGDHPGPHRA
jgi:hypothetical protein